MSSSFARSVKAALRQVSPVVKLKRRLIGPFPPARRPGTFIIQEYLNDLPAGSDVKVVFGGHWSNNPGWLVLTEQDQDITAPLQFGDGSVDVVFSEHVIEHVPFAGAVRFLAESVRILKKGGIGRIVCPMLDRMVHADFQGERGAQYIHNSLQPFFADEEQILRDLGINGVVEQPLPFFFAFLYFGHGHRFIWTSDLMITVMKAVGFSEASRVDVGQGRRTDACIERRRRGIYHGTRWEEELFNSHEPYDVESLVVEGVK